METGENFHTSPPQPMVLEEGDGRRGVGSRQSTSSSTRAEFPRL